MATYTDNYNLIKPTYAETADIVPLNNNFEKIDDVMHSSQISLAPAFDQTQAYSAGDVVMYELLMYEFTDSKAAGNWDATKVRRTTAAQTGSGSRTYGTASGQPAAFPDGSDNPLEACNVDINPVQDLHGYDKPWMGGAGKNKWPFGDMDYDLSNEPYTLLAGTYTISMQSTANQIGVRFFYADNTSTVVTLSSSNDFTTTFTLTDDCIKINFARQNAQGAATDIQIETGSQATTFEPYSNICPISGHSSVTVNVSPTSDPSQGLDTAIQLGQTVYGGQLNVLTGELKITHEYIDMGTLTWDAVSNQRFASSGLRSTVKIPSSTSTAFDGISEEFNAASNNDVYNHTSDSIIAVNPNGDLVIYYSGFISYTGTQVKTALDGIKTIYELATPQTVQLTPQEVRSILGQNYIEADSGEIEVVYIRDLNSCLADIIRRLEALEQASSGNRSAVTLSLRGAVKTASVEAEEEQKSEEPQEVKEETQEKTEEDPEEKQPEEEEESR